MAQAGLIKVALSRTNPKPTLNPPDAMPKMLKASNTMVGRGQQCQECKACAVKYQYSWIKFRPANPPPSSGKTC